MNIRLMIGSQLGIWLMENKDNPPTHTHTLHGVRIYISLYTAIQLKKPSLLFNVENMRYWRYSRKRYFIVVGTQNPPVIQAKNPPANLAQNPPAPKITVLADSYTACCAPWNPCAQIHAALGIHAQQFVLRMESASLAAHRISALQEDLKKHLKTIESAKIK